MLSDKGTIDVTDFGAGSRVFKSNRRQISKIARVAGISMKRAKLLFRLARYFQPQNIVEFGTSLGLSAYALHLGYPQANFVTVEGCPNTSAEAKKRLLAQEVSTVNCVNSEFDAFLTSENLLHLKNNKKGWNLIYLDGNHSEEATIKYTEKLLPFVTNNTVWILDDIHLSKDMENVWNATKQLPEVTVTIDTFQWGLVFFRKEQLKENFVVRV